MNATFFAIYNSMLNTLTTGTPQVLPNIPATTSDSNSSNSNSEDTATPNRKRDKEKERRAKTNQRFEELHNLIRKDGDGEMSQARILKAALTACIKHKREFHSDPRSRGLNAGLEMIKQVAIQHLESLNLPYPSKHAIQKLEKLFEDFWDVVLPVFTPNAAPATPSAPSTSEASTSGNADEERKKRKKRNEQGRRDMLDDGYGLLRQFIDENKLFSTGNEKIQVLEAIIRYLRNEPTPLPSVDFEVGRIQGRHLGLNVAILFYKSDIHLSGHQTALQSHTDSQLGSLNSSAYMTNFQFDNVAVMYFISLHPTVFSLIAAIIPPPTAQAPAANSVSVPQPVPSVPKSIFSRSSE